VALLSVSINFLSLWNKTVHFFTKKEPPLHPVHVLSLQEQP
jgi:hypothetical protein